MSAEPFALEARVEQRLAARLFNRVWELLDRADRGPDEDDEMLHAAHASRHHWGQVGDAVNRARGEWQCSRVYAVLGRAEPAMHHAHRCLDLAESQGLGPFDLGCGHEAVARAARLAGLDDRVAKHAALAREAAERVIDPEERQILLADVASIETPSD
jgi:hypothetical protein